MYREICNLETSETSRARLPLVLLKGNGEVWEADSIRGLVSCLIKDYCDAEDKKDDWHLRVRYARKVAMQALGNDKEIIIFDKNQGIVIEDNYAAIKDDNDYEKSQDIKYKIEVSTEKEFLKSLVSIGVISILERVDCKQLTKENEKCVRCVHNKKECTVYKMKITNNEKECESGTRGNIEEYDGGSYDLVIV